MKNIFSDEDLQNIRDFGGKTRTEMADHVEVSTQTYRNWENGVGEPKYSQFFKLCAFCGIDFSELTKRVKTIPESISNSKRTKKRQLTNEK